MLHQKFYNLLFFLILLSCDSTKLADFPIEDIKMLGNTNPNAALVMLDSIKLHSFQLSEYQNYKIELLSIRLKDKADIVPESDKQIKNILPYFLAQGTVVDQQEALYYAGSIYRDLRDFPSAINYFLQSVHKAETHIMECDSLLLRNAFSNLSYLYNCVQDNLNYNIYAQKEVQLSVELGIVEDTNLSHLGESFLLLDSIDQASSLFDTLFLHQINGENPNIDILSNLLYNYSYLRNIPKATECESFIRNKFDVDSLNSKYLISLGWYYAITSKYDLAEKYYKRVLEESNNLEWKYCASRDLLYVLNSIGRSKDALCYGLFFAQISDSLNLGRSQERASSITNIYKYNRDKEEELKIKEEKMEYQKNMYRLIMVSIFFLLLITWYVISIRHKHLRESVSMKMEINRINGDRSILREEMQSKTKELEETKLKLEKTTEDVDEKKRTLNKVNEELVIISNELKQKEQILNERMEQNQFFIKLLHQTELEKSAEEVILALRQSAQGRRSMSSDDWRRFYKAVDELYPSFNTLMLQNLGKFSQEQMQVCYLMRVGFSKPQIQNLTGLSRVTVWRWDKKFEWIYNEFQSEDRNSNKR